MRLRSTTATPPDGYASRPYAFYVMGVLMVATLLSLLDRYLPALLVGPIRADLKITDTQVSLIQGYAFSLFYFVVGVPLGALIDRYNRRSIIIGGLLFWSLMTSATSLAQNAGQLFLARAGVGMGEACLAPAAYSLIADYFEPARRGRAIGFYYTSLSIGAGASFFIGGVILAAMKHTSYLYIPGLGELRPWRVVFLIAGIPGMGAAILMLTVREPQRKREVFTPEGLATLRAHLTKHWRTFSLLYAFYALMGFIAFATVSWAPTLYSRKWGMPLSFAGVRIGVAVAVAGIVGSILAGSLSDRWAARDGQGARLRTPLFGIVINLAVLGFWTTTRDANLSLLLLGVSVVANNIGLATAALTLQEISPNELRGRVLAIFQIVAGLATAAGPTAVALVTDYGYRSDAKLAVSLAIVPTVG